MLVNHHHLEYLLSLTRYLPRPTTTRDATRRNIDTIKVLA